MPFFEVVALNTVSTINAEKVEIWVSVQFSTLRRRLELVWASKCCLVSITIWVISFLPLVVQELTERGFWRAARRFAKHIGSLSPLFEVFVCQIYANSLLTNLSLGGARYIATGRGFATARIPFSILYSRFAGPSI